MDKNNQTVWLIDSNIYIFRAWFVRKQMSYDKQGNEIHAVRGFLRFVYYVIKNQQPSQIAFAFDSSLKDSHRRKLYPAYKAQRRSTPDNLRLQFQYCRQFLTALGFVNQHVNAYEADDIIGTWAKQAQKQNMTCHILSGDKDLAQLIRNNDVWWDYGRREALNSGKVKKAFGVWPKQIPDQLAIAGDEADNIQGIQGIGMSTAAKLLRRFSSVDVLLSRIPEIERMQVRGAKQLQQLIDQHQDLIRLNRQITGIYCDIPDLPMSFERQIPDYQALEQLAIQLNLTQEQLELWQAL